MHPGETIPTYNNCRAWFHSDSLYIDIGIGNGFGGQGFLIIYTKAKFYTEPYFFTDVVDPKEVEPTYKIIYQKLLLDKLKYKAGDSLYGYIAFKSIGTDSRNGKIELMGNGHFRTMIKKR